MDEHEALLRNYLSRYPDMSAVRLLEELRARGYKGGYTVLRQRVRTTAAAVSTLARGAF